MWICGTMPECEKVGLALLGQDGGRMAMENCQLTIFVKRSAGEGQSGWGGVYGDGKIVS